MSVRVVRTSLLTIWFTCFGLSLAIVLYLRLGGWIEQDNLHKALTQLNSSYVPYLGVITAYYFATSATTESTVNGNNVAATLALLASFLWNAVILAFFVPLLYGHGVIEQSIKNTEFLSGLISWLVAPAIGFYFARSQNR